MTPHLEHGARFCRAYGVQHPIASAGMAFVASAPDLAIAVAHAGGLPAIGAGILTPDELVACIKTYREAAAAPLNLNFLTFAFSAQTLVQCCALKPEIVSFHWGHPQRDWIDRLHGEGIRVWEQVGSTASAQAAFEDGIDLVIIQGSEAGGHNYGELPLGEAIEAARAALGLELMLLAAGGISDGTDIARVMAQGADGVMLGSRLVASEEANAHPVYQAALVASDGSDTVRTSIFGREMPFFNPVRAIANDVVREWIGREDSLPAAGDSLHKLGEMPMGDGLMPIRMLDALVPTRDAQGDVTRMMLLAGEGIGKIRSVQPVAEIFANLIAEMRSSF